MTNRQEFCFLPTRSTTAASQQTTLCMKILRNSPMVGFISLIIGTTIIGTTMRQTDVDQVGFYKNDSLTIPHVGPGEIYFQLPWQRNAFVTVDVAENKTLLLENVDIDILNVPYVLPFCTVTYAITNVTAYVNDLKSNYNGNVQQMMNILVHQLKFMLSRYRNYPNVVKMRSDRRVDLSIVVDDRITITSLSFKSVVPSSSSPKHRISFVFGNETDQPKLDVFNAQIFDYLDDAPRNAEGTIARDRNF